MYKNLSLGAVSATVDSPPTIPAVYQAARVKSGPPRMQKYDPINSSMGIYTDTLNIFIRIAQILAMQGRRK
jgi:FtsH-binding integral membrane protein